MRAFAGLACAHDLLDAGVECSVLEASDGIGGRVRTDTVHDCLLNWASRSCSPPIQSVHRRLDVDKPELRCFEPGAKVSAGDRFHWVAARRDLLTACR